VVREWKKKRRKRKEEREPRRSVAFHSALCARLEGRSTLLQKRREKRNNRKGESVFPVGRRRFSACLWIVIANGTIIGFPYIQDSTIRRSSPCWLDRRGPWTEIYSVSELRGHVGESSSDPLFERSSLREWNVRFTDQLCVIVRSRQCASRRA